MDDTATSGLHENEIAVSDALARRLVDGQFAEYAALPLRRLPPVGTDHHLFRLGDDLLVRLPRIGWAADQAESDWTWLPRLAPHLPLDVPAPLALGEPAEGYPFGWTIVRWIEGETPTHVGANLDPEEWADTLGRFVRALRSAPDLGAPVKESGRGAPLQLFEPWVREWTEKATSIDSYGLRADDVLAVWADALAAPDWAGEPAWLHGDLHEGNLLVRDGRLVAVIDWGALGRGDPGVELNAMWGSLPAGVGDVYWRATGLDESAWRRARGHALAPSISACAYYRHTAPRMAEQALATVRALIASLD